MQRGTPPPTAPRLWRGNLEDAMVKTRWKWPVLVVALVAAMAFAATFASKGEATANDDDAMTTMMSMMTTQTAIDDVATTTDAAMTTAEPAEGNSREVATLSTAPTASVVNTVEDAPQTAMTTEDDAKMTGLTGSPPAKAKDGETEATQTQPATAPTTTMTINTAPTTNAAPTTVAIKDDDAMTTAPTTVTSGTTS